MYKGRNNVDDDTCLVMSSSRSVMGQLGWRRRRRKKIEKSAHYITLLLPHVETHRSASYRINLSRLLAKAFSLFCTLRVRLVLSFSWRVPFLILSSSSSS